jgi:hypothetical protein
MPLRNQKYIEVRPQRPPHIGQQKIYAIQRPRPEPGALRLRQHANIVHGV